MNNPYSIYKDKICINCINKECSKQMFMIEENNINTIKCLNYIKKEGITGYEEPKGRTARQLKSLMGFTQEY